MYPHNTCPIQKGARVYLYSNTLISVTSEGDPRAFDTPGEKSLCKEALECLIGMPVASDVAVEQYITQKKLRFFLDGDGRYTVMVRAPTDDMLVPPTRSRTDDVIDRWLRGVRGRTKVDMSSVLLGTLDDGHDTVTVNRNVKRYRNDRAILPERSSRRIQDQPKKLKIPSTAPTKFHKDLYQPWLPCLKDHVEKYFTDVPAWTDEMLEQVSKKMCRVVDYSRENIAHVEDSRIPMVMTGALPPPPAWKERQNILAAADIHPDMKCKAFSGRPVFPYTIPGEAAPSEVPVSVVESMCPETDGWSSKYAKFTLDLTQDWNGLLLTDGGKAMTGYSIILSQEKAWSIAHKHPLMFFNYAFNGLKSYILYDTMHGENRFNRMQMTTKRLRWHEFLADPTAYFAYIDGNTNNNFIAAPAWYSHDVYTCAGRGLYVGMGGFGLSKELHDARKILAEASDPGLMSALRISPELTNAAAAAWPIQVCAMDP